MDLVVKILFYFVVFGGANLNSLANNIDDYPLTKSCFIQYLHKTGKLDGPLPSTVPLPSRCRLVIPYISSITIEKFNEEFFSRKLADCVRNEFLAGEFFDYGLKIYVLRSSSFSEDAERLGQLEETSRRLDEVEGYIRTVKCKSNETDSAVNNSTLLEEYQFEYCMLKYAMNIQLVDEDETVNPHDIDTEKVNCTDIVAIERSKAEAEFKEKMSASDCDMNEFRSGAMFDWKVAVHYTPFYDKETFNKMIEKFLSTATSECSVQ